MTLAVWVAVDIGQIQGGFVMSLGYLLTEECAVDADGSPLNLGTWDYKIPSAYDIPLEFNVSLLKDTPNPNGIHGSKASAEPAMVLVASVSTPPHPLLLSQTNRRTQWLITTLKTEAVLLCSDETGGWDSILLIPP